MKNSSNVVRQYFNKVHVSDFQITSNIDINSYKNYHECLRTSSVIDHVELNSAGMELSVNVIISGLNQVSLLYRFIC